MDRHQVVAERLQPFVSAAMCPSQPFELTEHHFPVLAVFQTFPFDLPTTILLNQPALTTVMPHAQHHHRTVQRRITQKCREQVAYASGQPGILNQKPSSQFNVAIEIKRSLNGRSNRPTIWRRKRTIATNVISRRQPNYNPNRVAVARPVASKRR